MSAATRRILGVTSIAAAGLLLYIASTGPHRSVSAPVYVGLWVGSLLLVGLAFIVLRKSDRT